MNKSNNELNKKLAAAGLEICCMSEPFIDTNIPAYEFDAAIYQGDDILASLSGWSLPPEYEYGHEAIEELCDATSGDLLSAYGAVVCGKRYESQKPVVVYPRREMRADLYGNVQLILPSYSGEDPVRLWHDLRLIIGKRRVSGDNEIYEKRVEMQTQ
jgi:hypothetical protein